MAEYYVSPNTHHGAMNTSPPVNTAPAVNMAPLANAAPAVKAAPVMYPTAVAPAAMAAPQCGHHSRTDTEAILVLFILLVIITRFCYQ